METKTEKVKSIAGAIKDKMTIYFCPSKGVLSRVGKKDIFFHLGGKVADYKSLEYTFSPKLVASDGEALDYDSYVLKKYPISLWVDDEFGENTIRTIACGDTCVWQGEELVGMLYESFVRTFQLTPDSCDTQWSPGPCKNDRNYDLYIFDNLGLMLWVWRKRIRQILISFPPTEEDGKDDSSTLL